MTRTLSRLAIIAAAAAFSAPLLAQPEPIAPKRVERAMDPFLAQFAATYRFRLGKPGSFKITPKGDAILFLRSEARSFVQDLYSYDIATKQERVLLTAQQILGAADEQLSPEEKARRERMRLATKGLSGFSLSQDGKTIMTSLSGRLFLVDRETQKVREVTSQSKAAAIDPVLSRDGAWLAHCRGRDVYITELATGAEHALVTSSDEHITFGQAEFVAQEEMGRFHGYWFSPDAKFLCYEGVDTSAIETFHIADPTHPEREGESWPYPRPGKANAKTWLEIKPVNATAADTPVKVKWDDTAFPYIAHVVWAKCGTLAIVVQNREQTDELVLKVDPATGSTSTLVHEKDDAWVELEGENPRFLKDGSFLWLTERRGGKQLELRHADGNINKVLTEVAFGLQHISSVDDEHGKVYVTASTNPTQSEIFAVPLVGGDPEPIITGPGRFGLIASEDHSTFLSTLTRIDADTVYSVAQGTPGNQVGTIESKAERPMLEPRPRIVKVVGEREYWAVVLVPFDFDESKKYPVVAELYTGPTAITVNAVKWEYVRNQWLANQGYIVVSIDNRGTPNRDRAWERDIKGNLIDKALADQADALTALGKMYPQMAMDKIAVSGWSFGGYFAAMAVMQRPDIFACGIAGAPVTDWADYDTHYTERYMGLPDKNPEGYKAASCMTYVNQLSRPLLIIHGTADDNVYFMHSLKLSEALFRANKQFEFLPLAGFTHMVPDPVVTINLQKRMLDFLRRNIGAGPIEGK